MQAKDLLSQELWRWYILLVIANELDLIFTYFGLSRGMFLEANPLVAPHLYTWWPVAMKLFPLAGLALGIFAAVRTGHHRLPHALGAIRLTTAIYTVILVLHLLNFVTSVLIS
ncbi:MAG TPA: DUF5658 family protein [bacterium]|jgi:hypothetical protein|nr:DUF5658 family protein [bacterium]